MIWILVNTGWLVIDISNEVYSRAVLDIVQTGFAFYGFIKWGNDKKTVEGKN